MSVESTSKKPNLNVEQFLKSGEIEKQEDYDETTDPIGGYGDPQGDEIRLREGTAMLPPIVLEKIEAIEKARSLKDLEEAGMSISEAREYISEADEELGKKLEEKLNWLEDQADEEAEEGYRDMDYPDEAGGEFSPLEGAEEDADSDKTGTDD